MPLFPVVLLSASLLATPTDSAAADSTAVRPLTRRAPAGPVHPGPRRPAAPADTAPPVEYSEWYGRRLTVHRWASYATLPLFAFQYVAGQRLYDESSDAPEWATTGHGIAASGIAGLFAVNTVTGVWNMWDARKDPEGRKWRTTHAVLMLAADAGFTATGLLAERAERSPDSRRMHRNVAISSVAVATASYLMMLPPFRRE